VWVSLRWVPVAYAVLRCSLCHSTDATIKSFCAGTGKTDTAVQIMHVLYANNPGQRVLLITHSNQALNDLFSKLLERCAGLFTGWSGTLKSAFELRPPMLLC
jgi:hypothetical protein